MEWKESERANYAQPCAWGGEVGSGEDIVQGLHIDTGDPSMEVKGECPK